MSDTPRGYRIDLHTHSIASRDGGITPAQYKKMLASGLDYIAITDHNTISLARQLHSDLGDRIIVGEEISAIEGEIIGLYLTSEVPAGLSALQTVQIIKWQGGLVYIPHPFETVRKGLPKPVMETIANYIDIVETNNGRAVFQNKGSTAQAWAKKHHKPGAASSDAHGWYGWGKTYSIVSVVPSAKNLTALVTFADYHVGSPGVRGVLYPKINRLRIRKKRTIHAA